MKRLIADPVHAAAAAANQPATIPADATVLTQRQVAALAQVSVKTLQRLDSQNLVPGRIVLGRSVRYNRAAIETWLGLGQ